MGSQIWWQVSRASGITALALMLIASVWGVLYASRVITLRSAPKWLLDLHRFLGALAVVFTGVHVAGLVADSYVHFGAADVLVPFASDWKTGAVAWGIVAAYLLVAVELTSLLKKRMSLKVWTWFHRLSLPAMWLGVLHGATAGTDVSNRIYVGAISALVAAVTLGLAYRVTAGRRRRRRSAPSGASPVQARTPEPVG
jgi:DMSO/TMAO reductase YedYZ heme-binding membrane subunit